MDFGGGQRNLTSALVKSDVTGRICTKPLVDVGIPVVGRTRWSAVWPAHLSTTTLVAPGTRTLDQSAGRVCCSLVSTRALVERIARSFRPERWSRRPPASLRPWRWSQPCPPTFDQAPGDRVASRFSLTLHAIGGREPAGVSLRWAQPFGAKMADGLDPSQAQTTGVLLVKSDWCSKTRGSLLTNRDDDAPRRDGQIPLGSGCWVWVSDAAGGWSPRLVSCPTEKRFRSFLM